MSTKQTITIHHERKEPWPLVIDHVPACDKDMKNARIGDRNGFSLRARILALDHSTASNPPVITLAPDGEIVRFAENGEDPTGRYYPIIALDGQPTEPELVRVDSLEVGEYFVSAEEIFRKCRTLAGFVHYLNERTGIEGMFTGKELVRPLSPGEKLVITVTAEGT